MEFIEEVYPEGFTYRFNVKKRLFSEKSEFQKVEIVESTHHGRMLFNDGCAMVSERDERVYHEMMAHVPLRVHPNPKRVLVIGGGDGGTAREVLKHRSVEECVMVEIDAAVVEGCRKFIPQTSQVFENPRLKLIIGDGVKFVKGDRSKFDVILVDSTDPIGPAAPLFGVDFYQDVKARLQPGGVVVAQGETPFYAAEAQLGLVRVLSKCFRRVQPYNFTNMTYPGGLWSFIFAADDLSGREIRHERELPENLWYYNHEIHRASFALPSFMKSHLGSLVWSE